MTLEQQVTSLELSKRLKELGVKQESLFAWYYEEEHYCMRDLVKAGEPFLQENEGENVDFPNKMLGSAFTVAELGEMLPNYVYTVSAGGGRNSERVDYVVGENYHSRILWEIAIAKGFERDKVPFEFRDKTEANARAKMLIHLLENKLI